ncbi:MAG: hypothetical protein KDJ29_09670 [Hyphomicrobiales bacterium]|nr:hypothetical protein [Hyphomicrobiales bacterium]
MQREKKPLYRKVNTRTHGVWRSGGQYKWDRNTKAAGAREASGRGSMKAKWRNGRDYKPLYQFLLSKVGCDWDEVHSEAVARLDTPEPIFHMVALKEEDRRERIGASESAYFSGLYVDDNNRLAVVNPDLRVEDMEPSCPCCTHTFNGKPFVKKFSGWKF